MKLWISLPAILLLRFALPAAQTNDEMAIAFLSVNLPPNEVATFQQEMQNQYLEQIFSTGATLRDLPPELTAQQVQGLTTAFNSFDADHNGDSAESAALIQYLRRRRQ